VGVVAVVVVVLSPEEWEQQRCFIGITASSASFAPVIRQQQLQYHYNHRHSSLSNELFAVDRQHTEQSNIVTISRRYGDREDKTEKIGGTKEYAMKLYPRLLCNAGEPTNDDVITNTNHKFNQLEVIGVPTNHHHSSKKLIGKKNDNNIIIMTSFFYVITT
jgi:hypothetical protein